MTDYQKYVNDIKQSLQSHQQTEDFFLQAYRNSFAISNVYSELWGRAIKITDEERKKDAMEVVDMTKKAEEAYHLMLTRFQYANAECARQISINKALIEYVERLEKEIALSEQDLTTQENNEHNKSTMGQQ